MNDQDKKKSNASNIQLHALDSVLDSFAAATQDPTTTRAELYDNFHRRILACTDSLASAVFTKRPGNQFTLLSHAGWNQLADNVLADVKASIQHRFLNENDSPPETIGSTFVGISQSVNGVEFLYVLVREKAHDSLVEQVYEDLAKEIAMQIETFEIRRSANRKPQALRDLTHLVQLVQNVGKSKSITQLAMHLVNDLAKSTGADRVCYFHPGGRLIAVSGVSQVALKTSLARNLSRIAQIAESGGSPIESTENQVIIGDERRAGVVNRLTEELDSEVLYVSPIESERRCCGIVSFEYFQLDGLDTEWIDQRNLIAESLAFVAPVVNRAVEINSIPLIGKVDFLFNQVLTRPVRCLAWVGAIALMMLAGLYFLLYVERPFEIHAEGILQPKIKRNVFSPQDGEIKSLFVEEGSLVEPGQQLAIIESNQVQDQVIVIEGELAEANQQLQNLMLSDFQSDSSIDRDDRDVDRQTNIAAEIERLKTRADTLKKRLQLLETQTDELTLVSPIEGQVTTPDVNHRLDSRPVNRGDLLMAISAMDGEWEIELMVPDNRVDFIRQAESSGGSEIPFVRYRLAADSDTVYEARIREIDFRVQKTPEANETYARAMLDIDESELAGNLHLGSRVVAKINCGKRNNLFLLTYELKNKLREWFFY